MKKKILFRKYSAPVMPDASILHHSPSDFLKILIIRFSSIGDIILTTPVIRAAKKSFPNADIYFITKPEYADLVRFNPHLSGVFILSENMFVTRKELAGYTFDYILDLQNNPKSRFIRRFVPAKTALYKKNNLKKFLLV